MTPERWAAVEALYHGALARPAAERQSYLNGACADAGLRSYVEALLDQSPTLEGFLIPPAQALAAPSTVRHAAPLAIGQRLGAFELTERLGVGGMGEVYRAKDAVLGRDVAIKILPSAFTDNPDRLRRFTREAQILASLNHANIGAIHGLEASDGVQALVLELVDGETLADRLSRRRSTPGLPLEDVFQIARQLADALEAAHEKGIIHRDLKPANVMIRRDGVVKVLDFGLARLAQPGAEDLDDSTASPTLTLAGAVLGTPAYMAPEQARGDTADKRSDLWAFGAVFFEMLSGRCPFSAATVSDTLASVLSKEPDWTALPSNTPPAIRILLRRCLEKDRRRRMADASDVRLEIDDAIVRPRQEGVTPAASGSFLGAKLEWAALAFGLLAVAFAVPAVRHWREAPAVAAPETRVDIATPPTEQPTSFALSPDGRSIIFIARRDGASRLWRRSLASSMAEPLAGTEDAAYPFWSPDGRSIGFFAAGQLKRLDLGGGLPRTLASKVTAPGGTWSADGTILFSVDANSPLSRIPASGGAAIPITVLQERQTSHRLPVFLPDGRHFLFYAQGSPAGIYIASLASAESTRLTESDSAGVYVRPGWLAWVRAGTLMAQPLDLLQRKLTGEPIVIADGILENVRANAAAIAASTSGLLAFRSGFVSRRQLTWVDRHGVTLGTWDAPDAGVNAAPRVSPDGLRVAISRRVQGNDDLWLLDGTRTTRLTDDPGFDRYPVWSPDGTRIVFSSTRAGLWNLYAKPISGGADTRLAESIRESTVSDWSLDGQFILYNVAVPDAASDIWVLPIGGASRNAAAGQRASGESAEPRAFLATPFREREARFSPDGRWVAYESNESGRTEIYLRRFAVPSASRLSNDDVAGRWPVSTSGGSQPVWSIDGHELYYIGPGDAIMAAAVSTGAVQPTIGTPTELFRTRISGSEPSGGIERSYDVTKDGRFLIHTLVEESSVSPITLIQNWAPLTGTATR